MSPKKRAMYGFMATAVLHGVAEACFAYFAPQGSVLSVLTLAIAMLLSMYFVFAWLQEDRRQRQLPRSYGFNVGVVALGAIVIPVYLWRSRPRGEKVKALLGMLAAMIASTVLSIVPLIAGFLALGLIFGLPEN